MYVTHLMNHMKNQISALSHPFPSLDDLLKTWFDVGGSWLKYLLLMSLIITILFVFCLLHKIIASCITKCMTEPRTKIMMTELKRLIKFIARYMINNCNSVTLDIGRCNEREYSPAP